MTSMYGYSVSSTSHITQSWLSSTHYPHSVPHIAKSCNNVINHFTFSLHIHNSNQPKESTTAQHAMPHSINTILNSNQDVDGPLSSKKFQEQSRDIRIPLSEWRGRRLFVLIVVVIWVRYLFLLSLYLDFQADREKSMGTCDGNLASLSSFRFF